MFQILGSNSWLEFNHRTRFYMLLLALEFTTGNYRESNMKYGV